MQVNARKIYDEPNVLEGIGSNRLFLGILGTEFALQVIFCMLNLALPVVVMYLEITCPEWEFIIILACIYSRAALLAA